jgi:hypothetical protein
VNAESIYTILVHILLEQSFLFVSDNIQDLTTLVLGFSYLLTPFKWPFIFIPNLPHDLADMTESPVPYLIGILGVNKFKSEILNSNLPATVVIHTNKNLQIISKNSELSQLPWLNNLQQIIKTDLDMANYYNNLKMTEEYLNFCQKIYKNIYEIMKKVLVDPLEKLFRTKVAMLNKKGFSKYNMEEIDHFIDKENSDFLKKYIGSIEETDRPFATLFSRTQIFYSFFDELKKQEFNL